LSIQLQHEITIANLVFCPLVVKLFKFLIGLLKMSFGVALFHRLSETNFKNATYRMLSVSGAALLAKGTPFFVKIAVKFQAMWILVFA